MTPKSNSPEANAAGAGASEARRSAPAIAVWDLPLRLFHWSLVLCVIGSVVTIKAGGAWMNWHMRFGYAILALLLFRIIWGFIGGRHARFRDFIVSPGAFLGYLKGRPGQRVSPGHTPLGSLSVIAMILLFLVQAILGLFANDDIFTEGPLAHLISKEASDRVTGLHKTGELLLYALMALHLSAIAFYRFARGKRLVPAMITGYKDAAALPDGIKGTSGASGVNGTAAPVRAGIATEALPVDNAGLRVRALVTLAICGGFVYWLVTAF